MTCIDTEHLESCSLCYDGKFIDDWLKINLLQYLFADLFEIHFIVPFDKIIQKSSYCLHSDSYVT